MLTVNNLTVNLHTLSQKILLKNLSFSLSSSSSLGIIGPSGSGKTLLAKAILNLLSHEFHIEGNIFFKNTSLNPLTTKKLLGSELSMILQNPSSSLNPKMSIGKQISEAILCHFPKKRKNEVSDSIVELLEKVKISHPKKYLKKYPFELSGGEKQKVLIAIAISCNPSLIIADEPTTSLDSISRLHIISLLKELKSTHKFNLILISHDFSLISTLCDEILIMSEGQIIEKRSIHEISPLPKKEISKFLFTKYNYYEKSFQNQT